MGCYHAGSQLSGIIIAIIVIIKEVVRPAGFCSRRKPRPGWQALSSTEGEMENGNIARSGQRVIARRGSYFPVAE